MKKMVNSKDGFSWTKAGGLVQGVPTIGLIQPPASHLKEGVTYDVIVIGAGYTALTAARDATVSGRLNSQEVSPCLQLS